MNFFQKILSFSLYYKPDLNDLIIYDAESKLFAEKLFPKKNYTTYHTRYDGVSLYIFFQTIFKNGLKSFFKNYKINFFTFVNPKIVYTSTDNNIGFYKLKSLFPKILFIADQNGMRDKKFFLSGKKFKKKLYSDIFFCFGNNEKLRLEKIIKGKIYPLGNTLNNNKKNIPISKFKLKNIVLISGMDIKKFKKDLIILKLLLELANNLKFKVYFFDRPKQNNKDFIIKNLKNNQFKYIPNCPYDLNEFKKNSIFLFSHSTLGFEYLSKGFRVGCFNLNFLEHFEKKKYKNSGPFWENTSRKDKIKKLILRISKLNKNQWKKISKKYSAQFMFYDKNNFKKKKIIKKLTNDNLNNSA
tara:strand:- start:361 stop:1425 length:1065 start_codon:yes stop_codon:yes gene_type:complete